MLYTLGSSYYTKKFLATEITYGTITSVKYSSNRVNNKFLIDLSVDYLGLSATFKDQPGDFGFEFNEGDIIPVRYQRGKPDIAIIPDDAIDIVKQHSAL